MRFFREPPVFKEASVIIPAVAGGYFTREGLIRIFSTPEVLGNIGAVIAGLLIIAGFTYLEARRQQLRAR